LPCCCGSLIPGVSVNLFSFEILTLFGELSKLSPELRPRNSVVWHKNFNVAVRLDACENIGNVVSKNPNSWPTGRAQYNDSNSSVGEILLISEILICCDQDFKTRKLCLL